jgi:hypothetical protein
MAGQAHTVEADLEIEAILDRALESLEPKARPPSKTAQLRGAREKIRALQAKGFTLNEIADLVKTSKDTLRLALSPPKPLKKAKKKTRTARAAQAAVKPSLAVEREPEPKPVVQKSVPPAKSRKFPTNDDL